LPLPYRWQRRFEQIKSEFAGLFGGGHRQPRPRICPVCGSLVGINTSRCHECGTNLNFSLAALSKKMADAVGGNTPVTTVLLISNFLLFGVEVMITIQAGQAGGLHLLWSTNPEGSYRLGAVFSTSIFALNEWWRVVTAMFLHGGLIHIGLNMMWLMQFGPLLEEIYGSPRFLFVYTFTGAFGFLVSGYVGHFSLGASGALFGVTGAILAITTKRGGAFVKEMRSRLISSIIFMFVLGIWGPIGIDNWAHGGGLAAGFVLGKLFADREPQSNPEKQRAQILGWLAGLTIVASFVFMAIHFPDPTPWSP
jgi:rhomboid protease GluP